MSKKNEGKKQPIKERREKDNVREDATWYEAEGGERYDSIDGTKSRGDSGSPHYDGGGDYVNGFGVF